MSISEKDISRKFSFKRIVVPILLGLGAASYLLITNLTEIRFQEVEQGNYILIEELVDQAIDYGDESLFREVALGEGNYKRLTYRDALKQVNWTGYSWFWLLMALLMMVIRDLAYMYRIRVLTDKELSWKQSFHVIMMWEFASALTPSVVGGSGVALFILNREKINMGRSTAIVMVTALLDELFYIIMVPLIILLVGTANLFPLSMETTLLGITLNTQGIFLVGYLFIVLLTTIILIAVFYRPRGFKALLMKIFNLGFLKRWRHKAAETGTEIIIASKELKGESLTFWIKSFVSTLFSWTARYWVVNFLMMAFISGISFSDHLLIYARQLVMWVIMLISPTPGSSGIAEVAFSGFLSEFIPLGLAGALALLWRLFSYYPYLFIGAVILPRWLRSTSRR
jgi:glycosyltransferase 2 family protein